MSNTDFLQLPKHYEEHVAEKNAKVNRLIAEADNCAAFVFFSDIHVNENVFSSPAIIASILQNTPVKDVIFGGDITSSYGTNVEAVAQKDKYLELFKFAETYYVRGNHDVYNKMGEESEIGYFADNSLILKWFFSGLKSDVQRPTDKTYYYFDRPQSKLRYIALDTNEQMQYCPHGENYYEVSVQITQEQIDWLIDLLKKTPEGYKIVILGHRPVHPDLKWYDLPDTVIFEIIEAFNAKSKLKVDYQAFKHTVNADFSDTNGKILLSMHGHGHVDDHCMSDTGCVYYEINDDSYINNGGSAFIRYPRPAIYENALDVVVIDLDTGKINSVRYGAGEDKLLHD